MKYEDTSAPPARQVTRPMVARAQGKEGEGDGGGRHFGLGEDAIDRFAQQSVAAHHEEMPGASSQLFLHQADTVPRVFREVMRVADLMVIQQPGDRRPSRRASLAAGLGVDQHHPPIPKVTASIHGSREAPATRRAVKGAPAQVELWPPGTPSGNRPGKPRPNRNINIGPKRAIEMRTR